MSKESRRDRRREAARRDREDRDRGSFNQGPSYIVPEEELEKLGISEYRTSAEKDGREKLHKIHCAYTYTMAWGRRIGPSCAPST